jgi:flagellar biosynthesis/type III secretory pathway chaperone
MMFPSDKVIQNSDSLMDLLTAQCADLEKLLSLAREEMTAAEEGDFDELLRVVTERATLGERLADFQKQILDIRLRLGASVEQVFQSPLSFRMSELITKVLAEDSKTRPRLIAARQDATTALAQLDYSQRGTNAYMRENSKGLSYDRNL